MVACDIGDHAFAAGCAGTERLAFIGDFVLMALCFIGGALILFFIIWAISQFVKINKLEKQIKKQDEEIDQLYEKNKWERISIASGEEEEEEKWETDE